MLGRTDFQHIAGTRVPLDFVEVPSTLMEFFVPQAQKTMNPFSIEQQLTLSFMDQYYHSGLAVEPSFDTTKIISQLRKELTFPTLQTHDVRPQCQFGHLFSYGGSYYSYFWSKILAARLYRQLFFQKDTLRDNGERLRKEVLEHGNGKDPWEGLAALGVVHEKELRGVLLLDGKEVECL
jgi:intermediate peptidase